jgi:hypothetical protein
MQKDQKLQRRGATPMILRVGKSDTHGSDPIPARG